MNEQTTVSNTPIDKDLHVAMAKILFHFDRNNGPIEVTSDSKWTDSRSAYMVRGRRLLNALAKQGLRIDKDATSED